MNRETQKPEVAPSCSTVFSPRPKSEGTICILGAPRGGTSMIAGLVRKLGFSMGEKLDKATNEDLEFITHRGMRSLFFKAERESDKVEYIRYVSQLIQDRNVKHPWWGWKDPISIYYIREIVPLLRNPHFIFVGRDPVAISQREFIEEGQTRPRILLDYMKFLFNAYSETVEFLSAQAKPTLLVSYERALRYPRQAASAVAEFLNVKPSNQFLTWVDAYISPDRFTGSIIELTPSAGALLGTTAAGKVLVGESVRFKAELAQGAVSANKYPADVPTEVSLYSEAARALNAGELETAQRLCLELMAVYAPQYKTLAEGPFSILIEQHIGAGIETGGELIYPDAICGTLYMLGMYHLLKTNAREGLLYFIIAARAMKYNIQNEKETAVLSRSLYWTSLLHAGIAAKALRRGDIIQDMVAEFDNALRWPLQRKERFGGEALLVKARERLRKEVES